MSHYIIRKDSYLAHYGVQGMKWGVRNYQNADGSLTAAGRKHYGLGEMRLRRTGKNEYQTNGKINLMKQDRNGNYRVHEIKTKVKMDKNTAANMYNEHRAKVLGKMREQYKADRKIATDKKQLKADYKSGKKYVDKYMEKTYGKSLASTAKATRRAGIAASVAALALLSGYAVYEVIASGTPQAIANGVKDIKANKAAKGMGFDSWSQYERANELFKYMK